MTLELKTVMGERELQQVQDALVQLEQGQRTVTLPESLTPFFQELLRHVEQGDALTVLATGQALTTNQAAALLGVSRPFLVNNLLEAGLIPFHRVGSHRRVHSADLLAYMTERERRRALMQELSDEAQELDLYG